MEAINEIIIAEHWGGKVIMVLHYLVKKTDICSKGFPDDDETSKKGSYTVLIK